MTYTLTTDTFIIRDSDGSFIPNDPVNTDYQTYLTWLAAGNTPNPVSTPPIVIPQSVSDRQFFQAAAITGLITQTDALAMMSTGTIPPTLLAAINMLPVDQQFAAKMKVIGAREFDRNDPFVNALSTAMGQTATQVDALFTLANSL